MEPENAVAEPSEITVLFETDAVVVINKPSGLMVHEDGISDEATVVDWLLERSPEVRGVGEEGHSPKGQLLERSGVVHRLDRETSGVLILAKTQDAHQHLKAQFHDRLAKKEYRAFVYGRMNESWGTIDRPIGRSASDFRKRSAQRGAKGALRDALTNWETIGIGEYQGESFSYIRLLPQTGRTHQLRVHMKAVDRPIVGDELYAGKRLEQSNNLELTRLALHAHMLEIVLPGGEEERLIAPVPITFEIAAERIAEGE
ncbi:MAG: RluA family pseudouridine synthase [Patescibacteria group bacterium]